MRLDTQIELISYTTTPDEIGQQVSTPVYRTVNAKRKPIQRAEFVAAGQQDIRAAQLFLVHTSEHYGERKLRYQGQTYTIYRTFDRDDRLTELYCEVRAGG